MRRSPSQGRQLKREPARPFTCRRLLIKSVSAQLGQTHDTIVLEGNGVSYFVTKTHPDLGNVTAPVSRYYDGGSTPTARVSSHLTLHNTCL